MTTLKFTRTVQPQGPLLLSTGNPLSKGLVGVFNGGSGLQAIASKAPYTNINTATLNPNSAVFNGTSNYLNLDYPIGAVIDACTILAVVTPVAYPTVSICTPFVSFETINQTRGSRELGITATGGLSLGSMGSNGFGAMISGGTLPLGIPSVVIGSTAEGLVGKAWLNGVNVLSGTINTGSAVYGNGTPTQMLNIGRGFGVTAISGSYGYFQGSIQLALVYNRVISDAEVKTLSNNPWQVFAPIEQQIWVAITELTIEITHSRFNNIFQLYTVDMSSQYYRPSADVNIQGWDSQPAGSLAQSVSETIADDNNWLISPSLTGQQGPAIIKMDNVLNAGTFTIKLRLKNSGTGTLRIKLIDDAGSVQGTSSWITATTAFATTTFNLTTIGTATRIQLEVT